MKKTIFILTSLLLSLILGSTLGHTEQIAYNIESGVNISPFILSAVSFVGSNLVKLPAGILATGYTMVDIPKMGANPGTPKGKDPNIIIYRTKDIKTMPDRDEKGIKIVGDIVLQDDTKAIKIYATPSTIKVTQASEGEADAKGTIQNLEFEHPGSNLLLEEFLENNQNENLNAVVVGGDKVKKQLGTKTQPLQFTVESEDSNEADKSVIKLASILRGPRIAIYEGKEPGTASEQSA